MAKTYRIFRIFRNKAVKSPVIRDWELMLFSCVIILCELTILVVYTFAFGPVEPVLINSITSPFYSFYVCQVSNSTTQTVMIWTFLGFNILLVVAGAFMAYLVRHVDSAYNESRSIGFCMYSYFLIGILIIPFYFTISDGEGSESRKVAVRSVGILGAMFLTLSLLFFPKVKAVRKLMKKKRKEKALSEPEEKEYGKLALKLP
jgi:hypothetical protein